TDTLFRNGGGKWPLRTLVSRHLPKGIVERRKMGFSMPIDSWLRGPLREWVETLISPEALQRRGYFEPDVIRTRWAEHLSGTRNWQYCIWNILMFQAMEL